MPTKYRTIKDGFPSEILRGIDKELLRFDLDCADARVYRLCDRFRRDRGKDNTPEANGLRELLNIINANMSANVYNPYNDNLKLIKELKEKCDYYGKALGVW
jgi:hypothetical protein